MALTSFGYTWRKAFFDVAQASTSTLGIAGVDKVATNETNFQWDNPNQRPFGRETQTLWNYKAIGRYVFPLAIGVSGLYKPQSGRQWGRIWHPCLAIVIYRDLAPFHPCPYIHFRHGYGGPP